MPPTRGDCGCERYSSSRVAHQWRHARSRSPSARTSASSAKMRSFQSRRVSSLSLASMVILEYRHRFPILRNSTYLINHSLAAMPAAAEDRLREYARMWRERGIRAWGEGWWEMPITVGDQIGRIIGAPPGSTVMHQNVTIAEEIVLSCFPQPGVRNRIVYEEANFPSVRYLYQAKPDLEVVAVEDDDAIVDAIDERTLLVPISHVLFKNAEIQDVEP